MRRIINRFFIVLICVLSLYACRKDFIINLTMNNMVVPDGFNYDPTMEIDLSVSLPNTIDFSHNKSRIDILDTLEYASSKIIFSGASDNQGILTTTIKVPKHQSGILLKSIAGERYVFFRELGDSGSGMLTINLGSDYKSSLPDTLPIEPINQIPVFSNINSSFKTEKSSLNRISNGDFNINEFGRLSYWNSAMSVDSLWHIISKTDNYTSIILEDGNNVLKLSKPVLIYGGVAQLIESDPGDIVSFSCNIKSDGTGDKQAWLFLIARNAEGLYIPGGSFSVEYPPSTSWSRKTIIATMPQNTAFCEVLIWNHVHGGYISYSNAIVNIKQDETDLDGDGVYDSEDDYPDNRSRAFNTYYPGKNIYGTLAFKDMWPFPGENDYNDMVVDYNFKSITNAQNQIVILEPEFIIRAIGAALHSGFGFQMDIETSKIKSISNNITFSNNIYKFNTNGTESNQTKAVIMVFEDAYNLLVHPGAGMGINTNSGFPHVEPVSVKLSLEFSDQFSISELGFGPYNPFIVVDFDRGKEIHLPNHLPTDQVNTEYFGSQWDDTRPQNSKYYLSRTNIPWGLNTPSSNVYPSEKADLSHAFLKFRDWAESNGLVYSDWYLDKPGYRNSEYIYSPEIIF